GGVEGDRRVMVTDDSSDDGVEAVVAGEVHELAEQQAAEAATAQVAVDVDGILHRRRVRRARAIRSQRGEPNRNVPAVDGDDGRVATRVLVDPRELFGRRAGPEVERHGRFEDLDVVDRAQRLGVPALDQAGPELDAGCFSRGHGAQRYATAGRG